MKVVEIKKSVVYGLRDYFVKELLGSYTGDIEKRIVVDKEQGLEADIKLNLTNDDIEIVVSLFNVKGGIELGSKMYSIPVFSDKEKERIRLPEYVCGSVIELLQSHGFQFRELGNGVITKVFNDDETQLVSIWFSNECNFMSISRKFLEPENELVSEEYVWDKLGL